MKEFYRILMESVREIEKEKNDLRASRLRRCIGLINKALEDCPEDDPNWTVAANNRSYCNYYLANYDSVVSDLKLVEAADSDKFSLHINFSSVLDDMGRFSEALVHAEKCVELFPDSHESYVNLSAVQYSLKQYDKAVESVSRAMQICSSDKASINRSAAYVELGEFEKAFEDLSDVLKQNFDSLTAHANLGELYVLLDEKSSAKRAFSLVIKRVSFFERKDRSTRHYYPAITAESGLRKLGIDSGTFFELEAYDFGIPDRFFVD